MGTLFEQILNNYDIFDIDNAEKLDLTKREDVEKFHNKISELRENTLFTGLMAMLGLDFEDELNELDKFADDTYNKSNQEKEFTEKINRPSSKLSTQQGLQIHKLVQEYVDTMIRPYNNGQLTNDQINDAYAGLYEFAAWILNK